LFLVLKFKLATPIAIAIPYRTRMMTEAMAAQMANLLASAEAS
jgi:hypothetical protein